MTQLRYFVHCCLLFHDGHWEEREAFEIPEAPGAGVNPANDSDEYGDAADQVMAVCDADPNYPGRVDYVLVFSYWSSDGSEEDELYNLS